MTSVSGQMNFDDTRHFLFLLRLYLRVSAAFETGKQLQMHLDTLCLADRNLTSVSTSARSYNKNLMYRR
jgi:hypothetical protein